MTQSKQHEYNDAKQSKNKIDMSETDAIEVSLTYEEMLNNVYQMIIYIQTELLQAVYWTSQVYFRSKRKPE